LLWFIALASECIGLLLRKPAPELPLLAVDLVRYGLQHYDLAKMENELGVEPEPLERAITDAYIWFTTHNYLKAR
jgi:nucleoside-diphosphate-sugar epimerase